MKRQVSIARVSSRGQDEEGQLPELEEHAAQRGYSVIGEPIQLRKSASKGEHAQALQDALRLIQQDLADVVVFTDVDRTDRRGVWETLSFVHGVKDAGGYVEWTSQSEWWGKPLEDIEGELAREADEAREETKRRMARITRGNNAAMRRGAALRRPPYGWRLEGTKRSKYWALDDSAAPVVRGIFDRIGQGQSLRTVQGWAQEQTELRWALKSIRDMVANKAYATGMAEYTVQGEPYSHECPVIVSQDSWNAANASVGLSKTYRPRIVSRWTGILYCPQGHKLKRSAPRKDFGNMRYWRCPECRYSIRDDMASWSTHTAVEAHNGPLYDETVVKAPDTREARKGALERELANIGRAGLSIDAMMARMGEIKTELDSIAAEPAPRGRLERTSTGKTLGEAYREASGDDQAANDLLMRHNVKIRFMDQADKDGTVTKLISFGLSVPPGTLTDDRPLRVG